MSYSFTVWHGGDGALHVRDYTGTLPGHVRVSGHEDTLEAALLDEHGEPVVQASSKASKPKQAKEAGR